MTSGQMGRTRWRFQGMLKSMKDWLDMLFSGLPKGILAQGKVGLDFIQIYLYNGFWSTDYARF